MEKTKKSKSSNKKVKTVKYLIVYYKGRKALSREEYNLKNGDKTNVQRYAWNRANSPALHWCTSVSVQMVK